jgi:uncharacterized membrane protein
MTDFAWPTILILNAVLMLLVGVFVLWKVRKERKSGFPLKDERTAKISGKAANGTLWISYAFMISLMLSYIFGREFLALSDLDAGWTVISIMLVSSISNALLRLYYARKGGF